MWKILSLSSCHKASLGGIRHSRHVGNSCQLLMHTLFKIAFWAVSTQSNVQIYLPRSIILDTNGEYLCPCFSQGQKFGWHYAFSVSYDLFFVFSWLFLSEGRSLCAPFQTKSHCSSCSSISIPSSLLFTTWNTMVSMLWEGKLAANCSDGEKCATIGALQKCTVPEAWFPMVLCLSYDWALIHAAALFSVGVRRGLLLSKCLYSLFVLVIEGLPACYLSGMLV